MVRVRRGKAGDGGLDRPGAEGEKDSVDREDHLVDSEASAPIVRERKIR
mgnify:CR=1 FL=1